LVMTAKKPGFTEQQTAVTLRSLREMAAWAGAHPEVDVIWRITKGLHAELGVENRFAQADSMELAAMLAEVDAVVCTPSTAILEAWLLGRPTAALDFHNVPRFLPTAWTISAPDHVEPVMRELMNPPAVKARFQEECLHDCLQLGKPAAARVAELIRAMVCAWAERQGADVLPADLLGQLKGFGLPPVPLLSDLYCQGAVFQERDLTSLQVRIARAEADNIELRKILGARGVGYWLGQVGRSLWRAWRGGDK
jgi:hypothetical protein